MSADVRSYMLEGLAFVYADRLRVCAHAMRRAECTDLGGARVYVRELGEGDAREARICCGRCRGRGFLVGKLQAVFAEHEDAQAWEVAV